MSLKSFVYSTLVLFFVTPAVLANTGACMKCHEAAEFTGMSVADIAAAVRDTSIPPHKKMISNRHFLLKKLNKLLKKSTNFLERAQSANSTDEHDRFDWLISRICSAPTSSS